MRWAAGLSGLVVLGATLIACGSEDAPSSAAGPTTSTPITSTSTTTTTTTTRRLSPSTDLEAVCKGTPFPAAAPYTGPPPHPTQAHGFGTLYGEYDEWPEPWPAWAPDKADAGIIQLVLCQDTLAPEPTTLTCRYSPAFGGGKARSYKVELQVASLKLYETRTAKLVAETQVKGPRECSETASVREGETTVTSFTEVGAYAEAMRKYVLG